MREGAAGGEWFGRLPMVVRVVSHVTVWTCVLVPVIVVLSRGWLAIGDDAVIAIRAHQALSLSPPLVGMYSTAGNGLGHYLYDPGPLLFWLLAVPVHIDPSRGLLWGAAFCWGAALSLAIEAVWSTRLWLGCALVPFVAVDLLWVAPRVLEDPSWNAYFPIPFFIATLVLAWVVGTGSFGWWPALVGVASVAAQCHLIFAIPAVGLTLLAPVVGVVATGRPRRLRWLVVGIIVAVACWAAPLLQNLGRNGNLSALAHSSHGSKTLGLGFGLHILAAAGAPFPIWLRHEPLGFFSVAAFTGEHSSALGVIVLCLLAAICVAAALTRQRALAVLGVVGLVASISLVASFAIFPVKNSISVDYLIIVAWVVGILVWTVVVWAAVSMVALLVRPARKVPVADGRPVVGGTEGVGTEPAAPEGPTPAAGGGLGGVVRRSPVATLLLGVAIVGVLAGFTTAGLRPALAFQPALDTVSWDHQEVLRVRHVTTAIEHAVPRGPVVYSIDASSAGALSTIWITEGVAWQLEQDGWRAGLFSIERAYTQLKPRRGAPTVKVVIDGTKVVSIQHAH